MSAALEAKENVPSLGSRLCPVRGKGWSAARERGRWQVEWRDAFMLVWRYSRA